MYVEIAGKWYLSFQGKLHGPYNTRNDCKAYTLMIGYGRTNFDKKLLPPPKTED